MAWVPAAGRYLITRHADIVFAEQHPELFSSREKDSLVLRVMGANMLREDDPEHRKLRAAAEPPAPGPAGYGTTGARSSSAPPTN